MLTDKACKSGSELSSNLFCDLVFDLNLVQLIDQSTHSCGNILDLEVWSFSNNFLRQYRPIF